MFIEQVVEKNWEEESILYNYTLNEAMNKDLDNLYDEICEYLRSLKEHNLVKGNYTEVLIQTTGCPYCYKNGKFSGCSMCDWDSGLIEIMAKMAALRERNVELYADAVRLSSVCLRGDQVEPNIVEEITAHDSFSKWQMPSEVFNKLFGDTPIYKKPPIVGQLQARASSINQERIVEWKKVFRKAVCVSIGVETSNEWIRNHWINKKATNHVIIRAIQLLHEEKCSSCANILLGIPGFTEKQSIEDFIDTIGWLSQIKELNLIAISPLMTRPKTLQGIIDNIRREKDYNGSYTVPISIISFFKGLIEALRTYPAVGNKLVISLVNSHNFFDQNNLSMDLNIRKVEKQICEFLKPYIKLGSNRNLIDILSNEIESEPYYQNYCQIIDRQRGKEKLGKQLMEIGELCVGKLWGNTDEQYMKLLEKELMEMESL